MTSTTTSDTTTLVAGPADPPALAASHAAEIARLFAAQQANRWRVARSTAAERTAKLARLGAAVAARREEIAAAAGADFGKPAAEVEITEIHPTLAEIRLARRKVGAWMRPRRVATPLLLFGTASEVRCEPRGVVLIVAPWNYAFSLCVAPLVAAIAAGNCAILKPSEKTPHTSAFLKRFVADLFDESEVAVVEGGAETAQALLALPFDHVFFTGGTRVGRLVMAAAARHLASVTLELGGKSPAFVDETADVGAAADSIVWGRFLNAGQTCVAPDYVLVHAARAAEFVAAARRSLEARYGPAGAPRAASPDYCRIVDAPHHERLTDALARTLAGGAVLEVGGDADAAARYLAPTIVSQVTFDAPLMEEEIFGPILPILAYTDLDEALARSRALGQPLALYIFTARRATWEHILANTTAGATVVNATMTHYGNPHLPFGGVGASGQGSYHGVFGFRTFSHERAVLHQHRPRLAHFLYPPYRGALHALVRWALRMLE
jgi:aldehyde dehydrogenase (NAD+)